MDPLRLVKLNATTVTYRSRQHHPLLSHLGNLI